MRKMVREVFLGVRFLVSTYFVLLSFSPSAETQSLLVTLTALYFSISLLLYIKPEATLWINKLLDGVFVPVLVYMTGDPFAILSFVPLIVMHTNRDTVGTVLLLLGGLFMSVHMLYPKTLELFSTLIILTASPLSALVPDFVSTIKKDRDFIKELKSSYRKLLRDFARWERDKRRLENTEFLIEAALRSQDVRDFLREVKKRFKLRKIHVLPRRELDSYSPLMDRKRGLLSVPVKLDEGNAVVVFETENPFQLNDELLVAGLEKAGRMIGLFIAGFEDSSYLGKAINIG